MTDNNIQNVVITYPEPTKDEFLQPPKKEKNDNSDLIVEVKEKELSTYYTSTIFGKIFFNWTRYAMKLANKNPLKISDFDGVGENDHSENLLKPVSKKWYQEKTKKVPFSLYMELL